MQQDLQRYQAALRPLQADARKQPWAKERPWRTRSHVACEGGLVVVDLHDLKAKLARRAVAAVLEAGPPEAGALLFVVGQGRHSRGAGGVLGKVVTKELGKHCVSRPGWSVRLVGPARVAWITDRRRAPGSVTGGAGWGLNLLLFLLFFAFLVALAHATGLLS